MVLQFFKLTLDAVKSINRRYAKPHIKMTREVAWSLGILRAYLLFLVGLLVYKFIVTAMHR
jgi:hypothetical protein